MTDPDVTPRRRLPHRGRAWLLGVAFPVVVTAAAWAAVARWMPRLPDEVALHWGPDGVDRVGPVGDLLMPMAVMSGISLLVLAVLALTVGRTSFTRRMVLGLAAGAAVLFAGLLLSTVASQVGAEDVRRIPAPDLELALATLAAVVLGLLAGALAGADPAEPATAPVPVSAARTDLAAGERAAWIRSVGPTGSTQRWVGVGLALYIGASIWIPIAAGSWFATIIMLALVPLLLTMLVWHVRVDADGLTAKGAIGWPRQHVPAAEVVAAQVRQVSPFREFGGWGMRTSLDGTVGVVVRGGEGIIVERTGGRRYVVTVDDAATAAALLNTFAERARQEA